MASLFELLKQTASDEYQKWNRGPRLADLLATAKNNPVNTRGIESISSLLGMTPGIGDVMAAKEAIDYGKEGRYGMAAQALRDPEFYAGMGRGLLDTANRAIVAGLLGAPVDLTTMALRPFGYNVQNPVGGSEWVGNKMQQAGMVSPNRNALAEALAGFVDPATMQTGALKMAGLLGGLRQIKTEQQLAEAIANGEGKFVRWSRGPTLDKKRGGSRDYLSGSEHGAFSAVPINPEWATDPSWMTRRVGEYGFLRMKDPDIAPYLYSGRKVGTDSDGYDLISDIAGVAKISPSLLDEMAKRYGK